MEAWSGISLSAVTATGNLKQLYPTWVSAGVAPGSATTGQQIRTPCDGQLLSIQIKTDGTNGGVIEIWDVNGHDGGADVSSSDVITDTQLDALAALGLAKLIYSQNFDGSATTPPPGHGPRSFSRGLAARMVGSAGACELNLVVNGGFRKTTKI